ncbi:MAG: 5'-methylthioadenosine/adenosylhomocysteine nucleosidase [Bacteroidales bacterium]|nr:5'-methylthioadenosine/adenosylhomocysteine nucleosidase [Bacteroidales bacterium]
MKIGIIVAMSKELALLKPLLKSPSTTKVSGMEFIEGEIGSHSVVALQCGIGKVNAAVGTTTMIAQFAPDLIINTGVAGGADPSVNVMDVVVGEKVSYHDVWCGPECEVGVVQGLPNYFAGSKAMIAKMPASPEIKYGLIASGDQFIESKEKVDKIKSEFPEALAVDMESGAIAHVCELMKVPFLSMRVISDSPGASHNSTYQYNDFWEDAPKHSFAIVENLLNNL